MSNHDPRPTFLASAASATASGSPSSGLPRLVALVLSCLVAWGTFPDTLSGQEAWPDGLSVAVGMGPTTGSMSWQIAASKHLSSTRDVGLRLLGSIAILGDESANDLAMLFGVRTAAEGVWLAAAAGPSLTWASDRECVQFSGGFSGCEHLGPVERTWGGGASGQATLGWRRVSFAVVGGVNTTASYAGVIVSLHLGPVP